METTGLPALQRLAELDLSVEIIAATLRRADSAADGCSDLDPPILQGLLRWARATRYLREQLVPTGWSFDNPRNLARTIHPSGEFAVVIATGDDQTGRPDATAGPRHPRGYATEQAVAANSQLSFDFGSLLQVTRTGQVAGLNPLRTWLLLFTSDRDNFFVELSMPEAYEDGRITAWTERILLPAIPRRPSAASFGGAVLPQVLLDTVTGGPALAGADPGRADLGRQGAR